MSKQKMVLLSVLGLISSAVSAQDFGLSKALGSISDGSYSHVYLPNPSRYGSAPSLSNAIPGTAEGDAAYARNMRIEYAKDGLANSTANAESAMRRQSAQSANCGAIVTAAATAKKEYVNRHMAPDPTKVIQGSTCFVDVMKIKIPKSGLGAVDSLVGKFSDFVSKAQCSSTSGYWDKIARAAQSGNLDQLKSAAINAGTSYVAQEIYSGADSGAGQAAPGQWQQPGGAHVLVPTQSQAPAASLIDSLSGWIKP